MPIIEAGIRNADGILDPNQLIGVGPSIEVSIGHFRPRGENVLQEKENENGWALIDTGASWSCIDAFLARALKLPVVDKMTISGVGGQKIHNVHLAQIHIPNLNYTQHGLFAGVDLQAGGQVHKALLGRTFLKDAIMIYDGFRSQVTITVV